MYKLFETSCFKNGIRVWRSLVSRLNGVQEALSSNLSTRTKSPENESFQDFFYLFQRHLPPAISCDIIGQLKQYGHEGIGGAL